MNIKLLFIPLLLFSSQLYAETIHLGILNTSGNEAENVLYAETASVLKDKLKPRNVEVSTYDLPGVEKAIAAGKWISLSPIRDFMFRADRSSIPLPLPLKAINFLGVQTEH